MSSTELFLDQDDTDLRARMGLGGNNPPKNDIELLVEDIAERSADLLTRYQELMDAAGRAPAQCDDDATAGNLTDLIGQLSANAKALDARRTEEKAPFLQRGNAVQGFFAGYTEAIAQTVTSLKQPLGAFLKRKAEAERRAAQEAAEQARIEAQRQAERAQRLEQENRPNEAAAAIDSAVIAEETAAQAEKVAAARPAALASTRGAYGTRGGLTSRWAGTITDRAQLDLESLRPYFATDDLQKALNGFVKANCKGQTGAELKGAKIELQTTATVR